MSSRTRVPAVVAVLLTLVTACSERANPTEPADPTTSAGQEDPLYTGETESFSASWAVQNDCPTTVMIRFSDDGPELTTVGPDEDAERPMLISWNPPCHGLNQQIDFDGNPVARTTGSPDAAACQHAAEQSRGDGSAVRAVAVEDLAAGDVFCEYARYSARVIRMTVTDVSAEDPLHIDWEFTAWAVDPAPTPEPGDARYTDEPFTFDDSACARGWVSLGGDVPTVQYHTGTTPSMSGGDVDYFPACRFGDGKIRFSNHTVPVDGALDRSACREAATGSSDHSPEIPLPDLRAGSFYCQYLSDIDRIVLLEVVTVDGSTVEWTATAWDE